MTFSSLRVASILSAALLGCLTATGIADILADGVPNVEDTRLYAWYDGDQAIGGEAGPPLAQSTGRRARPRRDLTDAALRVRMPCWNRSPPKTSIRRCGSSMSRSGASRADSFRRPGNTISGRAVQEQLTVFVAATVRDPDATFLFAGNQPEDSGTEANAGYPAGVIEPGYWSFTAGADRIQTAPLTVDQLQYHAFTFRPDATGAHHLNGDLVGEGNAGLASLQGFVLGGRGGGSPGATIDLAEILVYREAAQRHRPSGDRILPATQILGPDWCAWRL